MDSSTVFLLIVIFILIIIFSLLKTTCPRREQSIMKLQPVPTSVVKTTTGPTQSGVQRTTPSTPQYTTPPTPQYTTPPTPQYTTPSTPQYTTPSTPQYTTPSTPQYTTPVGQGKFNLFRKLIEEQTKGNNLYMDEMIHLDNGLLTRDPKIGIHYGLIDNMPISFVELLSIVNQLSKSIIERGDTMYTTKTDYLNYIDLVIDTLSKYSNGLSSMPSTMLSTPQPTTQPKVNLFAEQSQNIDYNTKWFLSNIEVDNALIMDNKIPESYILFLGLYQQYKDYIELTPDKFYVTKEDYLNYVNKVIDMLSTYVNKFKSLA